MRFFLLILLLSLTGAYAEAQPRPDAEELLRTWLVGQRDASEGLDRVTFDERMRWTIDGPFGARETAVEARVAAVPRSPRELDRDVRSVTVDGRPLPPREWRPMARRTQEVLGPAGRIITSGMPPLARLLTQARPVGGVAADRVDAEPAWRLEAVPREPMPALERVTLWFSQSDGRLLRSRSVIAPRQGGLVSTVDYERFEGIDLPADLSIEGTLQTRRRGRPYTVLFDLRAAYDAFRLYFSDE